MNTQGSFLETFYAIHSKKYVSREILRACKATSSIRCCQHRSEVYSSHCKALLSSCLKVATHQAFSEKLHR